MHDPLAGFALMIAAIVLVYGPILAWILICDWRQQRRNRFKPPMRHHDHLFPATPRTAAR